MKIGILTFHCAHNYGAVLQAYATQEQLKNMGHEVEIIDYRPEYLPTPYGYKLKFSISYCSLVRKIGSWGKIIINWFITLPNKYRRRKRFNRFIENKLQLPYHRFYAPFASNYDFDCFIMGSDQIWNTGITRKPDDIYFGNFRIKPDAKRITYAASMPLYVLSDDEKKQLANNLTNFAAISVREIQLKTFLMDNFNVASQLVLDPTLLVCNSVWQKIAVIPKIRKKYVLVYTIGVRNEAISIAQRIAKEIGGIVIELSNCPKIDFNTHSYSTASPEEFLGWFRNASFVVTSSFHGTAFSISFQKPFYSILRGNDKDSRQQSVLTELGLKDRLIQKEEQPNYSEINNTPILQTLEKWRELSYDFLRTNI